MDKIKLENVVITICRLSNVSEDKIKQLLEKYFTMTDKEIIKDLAIKAYIYFSNNEEFYNYSLTLIRSINEKICPSVEEMKKRIENLILNRTEGNMGLEQNHELVNESLVEFTKLFNNAGIDYYIVGSLPCFIKTGEPLFRYHDDIDIMINEEDIEKVKELVELAGYEFHDDRFPTVERYHEMLNNRPPHTVLAQNPDNEFHIGFFCFIREIDHSITMREYSHRLENEHVIVDVLERRSGIEGTELRYDDTPTKYLTSSFKTSTIENIYQLKSYNPKPKDLIDMQKFKPYINQEKLKEIKNHPNQNVTIYNVSNNETKNRQR